MTGKWNLGRLAAIGGLTAAAALLTGLGPVRADELADLRANQLLLQQRIDQLAQMQAQAPPPPGTTGGGATQGLGYKAAPGAPTLGGSFPRSFLIPGTDTSIRVGGFVDFTALDFLNGGGGVDGSNYGSNSGQNGTLSSLPLAGGFVPGIGFTNPNAVARAPSRNNGILEIQPAAIPARCRDPHPHELGRGADILRVRLGRLQRRRQLHLPDLAAGRRQQHAAAPPLCLRHVGRVPCRPGALQLFRRRCRHRIDGIRRRDRFDRRPAHPAGALHGSRSVWQRVLGVGGKPVDDRRHPGRLPVVRLQFVGNWHLHHAAATADARDLQRGLLHRIDKHDRSIRDYGDDTTSTVLANPTVAKAPNLTFASYWAQPWGHFDIAGCCAFTRSTTALISAKSSPAFGGHYLGRCAPELVGVQQGRFPVQLCRRQRDRQLCQRRLGDHGPAGEQLHSDDCLHQSDTGQMHRSVRGLEHHSQPDVCLQHQWRLSALVDAKSALDGRRRLRQSRY